MEANPEMWDMALEWLAGCTPRKVSRRELTWVAGNAWERYRMDIFRLRVAPAEEEKFWRSMVEEILMALRSECSVSEALHEWPYYRFIQPLLGAREVLEWLKLKTYKVAVYSNTVPSLRSALQYHGLSRFIDYAFPSTTLGFSKPDFRGYSKIAEIMRLRPNEIAYFDESRDNVRGAQHAGMFSFLVDLGNPAPGVVHDLRMICEILD